MTQYVHDYDVEPWGDSWVIRCRCGFEEIHPSKDLVHAAHLAHVQRATPVVEEAEEGMTEKLSEYKGNPVYGATVAIRNTGDGLSEAMDVEPVELPLKSTVHVVLECEVEKHRYDPIKDTDGYQLVNMLKAGRATIVDEEVVAKYLDDQERLIDEAKGEPKLAFVEGPDGGEIVDADS